MIERYDVNEEWAHCGIIKAGDFCFLNYCAGNVGGSIEQQQRFFSQQQMSASRSQQLPKRHPVQVT